MTNLEDLKLIKEIPEYSRRKFFGDFFGNSEETIKVLRREKYIKPVVLIGAGTCGLAAGAAKVKKKIVEFLKQQNIDADIIEIGCIGFCSGEPLVDVIFDGKNRISFQKVTEENAFEILDSVLLKKKPTMSNILGQFKGDNPWKDVPLINEHTFFKKQMRFVLKNCGIINPLSIEEYAARGGYLSLIYTLTSKTPSEVIDEIENSGLRGRGGGGFPTGRKWRIASLADDHKKYIICNADEGDPGAFMDRAVIEGDPHRVIEGMIIGAYAIGASKGYVYIRAEYPLAVRNLAYALEEARRKGLLGNNIYDSGFSFDITIKMGAGAFVCGEETALIQSIEGKRGMPRPRPPFPAARGVFAKPTVINNVETFANVPEIIRVGHQAFSSIGTKTSKGTKVFALSGNLKMPGLAEVPMGITIKEIVYDIGGGIEKNYNFKAVQIGGPSGGCIPESKIETQIDYESLKEVGAMMGSGGLVVMDERTCMVDVAKYFMSFIKSESCGKCIPCREGTKKMLDILEMITKRRNVLDTNKTLMRFKGIVELENLARVIKETSLCGLGQTAPNPVLSTLKWFRDEYESHVYERICPSGACKEMLFYHIDVSKCKGCTLCAKGCPAKAIVGSPKNTHYIVEDKCIGCGNCVNLCKFDAIAVSSSL